RRAVAVGIFRHHVDGVRDIGFAQRVGATGGAADVGAVALPLVADGPQTVGIRQRVRRRQNLVLLRRAADRHRAGRQVVDVGHGGAGRAGFALRRAVAVGIFRYHVDGVRDIGFAQRVGATGGAADVGAVALPLVADGPQT